LPLLLPQDVTDHVTADAWAHLLQLTDLESAKRRSVVIMRLEDRPEWLVEIVTVLRLGRVQVGQGEVAQVLQTVAAGVDIAPVDGRGAQLGAGLDVEQEDQPLHQYYSLRT
jgi:hypothetical protein